MSQKSLLVTGSISRPLRYRLLLSDPSIRLHTWEMAVVSVAFSFKKNEDKILVLSSNYVQHDEVNNLGAISRVPAPLNIVHCIGKAGQKKVIGIRQKNWMEIGSAQEYLEIYFNDVSHEQLQDKCDITVQLLVRRKS